MTESHRYVSAQHISVAKPSIGFGTALVITVTHLLASTFVIPASNALAQDEQAAVSNRASEGLLATRWREEGPTQVWRRTLGEGESAIVWSAGVLYTMFRKDESENVVALNAKSGDTVWNYRYEAQLADGIYTKHGRGPHAAPLVTDDRIVAVGISGLLNCLAREDGRVLWSHDLMQDFGGVPADCGYSAAPVLFEDTVILPVGGKGNSVMAFRLTDGSVAWKRHSKPLGYATPIVVDVAGEDQLIVFMAHEVIGLNPRDGSLKWRHPHKTDHGVNACRPVWTSDSTLFISSAYGVGTRALRLTRTGTGTAVNELWHQRKMQIHFGTLLQIDGLLFGTSGDFGPVFLTAVDARTGDLVWQRRDLIKKASGLTVDGKLLMLDEDGFLVLATVAPQGVTVHARHQITKARAWTAPTLVGTTIYVRDNEQVMAFDLG